MQVFNKYSAKLIITSVFLFQSCFSFAQDSEDKSNWSFSVVSDFSKAKDPVRFNAKTTTLKTGSVGLQGNYNFGDAGEVFVRYGVGYSPSETLTFSGATVSGSISADSYEYGYVYPYDIIDSPFSLDFKISKTINQHTGNDLTGLRSGNDVIASIDSENNFTRSSVGLNYQLDEGSILTAGIGRYNWSVSAQAKGWFVDSNGNITDPSSPFMTNINPEASYANGSDGFYFLETTFPFEDRVVSVGVRRSQFNTTTENTLNEVYGGVSLQF